MSVDVGETDIGSEAVRRSRREQPLIYACSGCSSAAQLANAVAVRIDREHHAEMSCIAGIGGDVPALLRVARSGREIVVLDGCPLQCAKSCLDRHGIAIARHHQLDAYGVKKIQHGSFDPAQADEVYQRVMHDLATLTEA